MSVPTSYVPEGPHAITLAATALVVAALLAAVALFARPSPALDGNPPATPQTNETGTPNQ